MPKNKRYLLLYVLCLLLVNQGVFGQADTAHLAPTSKLWLIRPGVSLGLPLGDFAQRFGNYAEISFEGALQVPGYWQFYAGASFIAGARVKQDPIAGLRTPQGYVIGANGRPANTAILMRGYRANGGLRKLWPVSIIGANKYSGLFAGLEFSFLWHKFVLNDYSGTITQLEGDKRKAYDHLTGGLLFGLELGYQYLHPNRAYNLELAIEGGAGPTASLRSYRYEQLGDEEERIDAYLGFKLAYMFTIYRETSDRQYYFY